MVDFKRIVSFGLIILFLAVFLLLVKSIGLFGALIAVFILLVVGSFGLIAFTTGFKKSGRIMGGLFVLIGKPGCGKSYCGAQIAIDRMKEGRLVFTNFPVVTVDGKYSTRVIEGYDQVKQEIIDSFKSLMRENLTRAVIILDEAHMFFWSRDFKKFTQEDKDFFTFLSQHEIEMYVIVQHEDRVDTIINDCANLFGVVEKLSIPFLDMPIRFTITWWSSEEELKAYTFGKDAVPFEVEKFWFSKDTASSYDTRFFGHDERPRYQGITWVEFKKQCGILWRSPTDVSLARQIRLRFFNRLDARYRTFCQRIPIQKVKSVIHCFPVASGKCALLVSKFTLFLRSLKAKLFK